MSKKITIEFSDEDAEMLLNFIQFIFETIEANKSKPDFSKPKSKNTDPETTH